MSEANPASVTNEQLIEPLRLYRGASDRKALLSVAGSFGPFVILWWATLKASGISIPLMVISAFGASLFLGRIFLILHDCAHNALFRNTRWNNVIGNVCGAIMLTPFRSWRRLHMRHHSRVNDLDHEKRDIFADCLTLVEYRNLPRTQRLLYRIGRSPLILYGLIAPIGFLFVFRFPYATPRNLTRERRNIHLTSFAGAGLITFLWWMFGLRAVLLVHLPIFWMTTPILAWFFSVQHVFRGAHWYREKDWNLVTAALNGVSHLDLPPFLHWVTDNIGYHHLHHLDARIPAYNLRRCQHQLPGIRASTRLTLWGALKATGFALYDEDRKEMVPFPALDLKRLVSGPEIRSIGLRAEGSS